MRTALSGKEVSAEPQAVIYCSAASSEAIEVASKRIMNPGEAHLSVCDQISSRRSQSKMSQIQLNHVCNSAAHAAFGQQRRLRRRPVHLQGC